MTLPAVLSRLGFDVGRLRFAAPTAVAAALALVVAWALGLEHPQWSAMTVWAASQPTRGQLLEKSFFRAAGTMSGTTAGVLLVTISVDRPALLVVGLAVWIALCAGIGNLQRGFVSYGTMLAGYSAAMVSLLDTAHPTHVFALGLDRLATVLVGVAVALAVGGLFAGIGAQDEILARTRRLTARLLRDMALRLRAPLPRLGEEQRRLLSEMAAIEDGLDPHGAGSLRSRRAVHAIRSLLIADVAGLLWLRRSRVEAPGPTLGPVPGPALEALAEALEGTGTSAEIEPRLAAVCALAAGDERLAVVVEGIAAGLRDGLSLGDGRAEPRRLARPVVLHRDWIGAREALIRAFVTMLLVGAAWLATGWSGGPFLLLGMAIMISLFSTFDDPARFMGNVLAGQVLGAAGALACAWLVWPHVGDGFARVAAMIPFIALGVPIFAHRRTLVAGFDYNMVLLLLLQPGHPPSGGFLASLMLAAAVAAAPITAWVAYRLVYPVDSRRRMSTLIAMMVHDLAAMARTSGAPSQRRVWRARLYHRLLRLVRWAEKAGEERISVAEGSLAVLDLGGAVLRIHELLREPGLSRAAARRLEVVLKRVAEVDRRPERLCADLDLAARRLARDGHCEAGRLADVARAIAADRAFFLRAARGA